MGFHNAVESHPLFVRDREREQFSHRVSIEQSGSRYVAECDICGHLHTPTNLTNAERYRRNHLEAVGQ